MSAGSQNLRASYEELENAWEEMEAALDGGWNELAILGHLYEASSHDPHSVGTEEEAEIWMDKYLLDEEWAQAYAESFLAYREDNPDITREEFRDMVYSWDRESWEDVAE